MERPRHPDTPGLDEVIPSPAPPVEAWACCFLTAASEVTSHNDTGAWIDRAVFLTGSTCVQNRCGLPSETSVVESTKCTSPKVLGTEHRHQEWRFRCWRPCHFPAAFWLRTAANSCNSLWSEFKGTHDPDVTAAETQFRMDGAPRTWSCLSHLCDAHILDSLMESRK